MLDKACNAKIQNRNNFTKMSYPTIDEYKDAIRLAEHSFGSLTHLRPEYDATGDLHFSSGNFALVFKMRDTRTNRPVAVKCFVREQPLRRQRFAQISACLDALHSPYLLRYTYHPEEIWVETALDEQREFEVMTLDWVEGQTLNNYLQSRCDAGDTTALRKVAEAFDRLAIWLLEQPFAHGDLKPDNILVTPLGGLVLVDYDGMFTPDMAGQEATELGSPAFRHPRLSLRDFGKYIDHMPILVLSLSLHVLAEHPDWLETYYQGDNLILTANDLLNANSGIFHRIRCECEEWTTQNRLLGLLNALQLPMKMNIPATYLRPVPDYNEIKLIPYVTFFIDGHEEWGYCDGNKRVLIESQYNWVKHFSEGLAWVRQNELYCCIDEMGREVIPPFYDSVYSFKEGKAMVRNDEKWGFVDKSGNQIIPCIYDYIGEYNEGLAQVRKGWKHGFIDKTGNEVIPCFYDYVQDFSEGLAYVGKDRKYGFIDKLGNVVISLDYKFGDYCGNFSEGLAEVKKKDGKYGFIDKLGNEVIPRIYDYVNGFSEGLAAVKKDGKYGFIDKLGNEVIPCIYDSFKEFKEGLVGVKKYEAWGFVDKAGYEIIPCVYSGLDNFSDGLAFVRKGEKTFYIDKRGVEYWTKD